MEKLKVVLFTGKEIQVEQGSYAVEEWYGGKWHVVQCFPGTKTGYKEAESLMYKIDNDYARIQQYM